MVNTPKHESYEGGMTIFYVDDDRDDLEVFKDAVLDINKNLSVHTHNDGDKLLKALDNPPPTPNVIFLDLNMPGKNGFEVLKEIRETREMDDVPVIVLTTSDDEKIKAKCRDLGANYFITKANHYIELKKSIDHALNIDWATFRPDAQDFFYKN